jgi:hypothetical protein
MEQISNSSWYIFWVPFSVGVGMLKQKLLTLSMRTCIFSSRVSSYNHVLSVSRARFITAGAIDLKLCRYVPQGEMTLQTKIWSDLILDLATRGPKPKTQKVLQLLN